VLPLSMQRGSVIPDPLLTAAVPAPDYTK
jgi:hypothetical protein